MTSPLMAILSSLRTGGMRQPEQQGGPAPDRLQMLAQAKIAQRGGGMPGGAPGGMPGGPGQMPPMGGRPPAPGGMGMGMRPGGGYGRPRFPSVMGRE